ncbi:MAG: hypothetical protein ACLR4Z_05045 [Butyricicoccaceae bacterium]
MTLRASIAAAARQGLFFVPFALILPHLFGLCRRAVLSGSERPVRLYSGALRHASGRAAAVRRKKSA